MGTPYYISLLKNPTDPNPICRPSVSRVRAVHVYLFRGRDELPFSQLYCVQRLRGSPQSTGSSLMFGTGSLQKDPEKRPSAERLLRTRAMQSRLMFHSARFQKKVSIAQNPKTKAKGCPVSRRSVPLRKREVPISEVTEAASENAISREARQTMGSTEDALRKNPQTARPKPDTPRSKPQTPTRAWQHGTPSTDESQAVIQRMRQHIAPDRKLGSGEQNPESPRCCRRCPLRT